MGVWCVYRHMHTLFCAEWVCSVSMHECVCVCARSLSNATSNDFVFELQPANNLSRQSSKWQKNWECTRKKKIELKWVKRVRGAHKGDEREGGCG